MKILLIILAFMLSVYGQSFDKLFDKITQPNIKLDAGIYHNHKLVKMLQSKLYDKNIETEHNIYKDETTIRITDIQEKHGRFWEIDYDKYYITYQVINGSKSLTNSEIISFENPSPYSLYLRLFLILVIIALLYRMHNYFKDLPNFKTLFITYGPALLIIFALIQGYFFPGAI